ncbi:MAG TPA: DUF502 domain-containing protein [Polyangiaceae bacterium]|jgi:uncharacterized membrane protein|nr:DUF502 domain-containing protein [Polyangiaceae bacterium]
MLLRRLPRYFFRGALITVPVGLTLYLLYFAFNAIDSLLPLKIPGLGLVVTISLVTLVGFLSSSVIGRTVVDLTERTLRGVPFVKLLYNSIKDLVGAFVGNKKSFNQPVAVQLGGGLCALGFITREQAQGLDFPEHTAVYFPQSYNFAGNLVLVPRERVQKLNVSSSELMTFIVSGGVSGLGVGQPLVVPPAR